MLERTAAPGKKLSTFRSKHCAGFKSSTAPLMIMMLFPGMTTADNTTSLAPALDKNAPDYTWQRGARYVSAANLLEHIQSTLTISSNTEMHLISLCVSWAAVLHIRLVQFRPSFTCQRCPG